MLGEQEDESLLRDMIERVFQDLADPQVSKMSPPPSSENPLWAAIEDLELPKLWVSEDLGGVGGQPKDVLETAQLAGQFALDAPLVETILANRLFSLCGIDLPKGPGSVAPLDRKTRVTLDAEGRLHGKCRKVPFLRHINWVGILAHDVDGTAWLCLADLKNDASTNRGEPSVEGRESLQLAAIEPLATAPLSENFDPDYPIYCGAALRSAQIAGALSASLELSVAYAQNRKAFGREISRFQAIQHNLAIFAGQVAAATAAMQSTLEAINDPFGVSDHALLAIAAAKCRAGEAAAKGAAIAHQVHGAIGFTRDYHLYKFTQRLRGWQDDFGSEAEWALRLGALAAKAGPEGYWPMITEERH